MSKFCVCLFVSMFVLTKEYRTLRENLYSLRLLFDCSMDVID
jgi:hypothetical protein